MQLQRDEEIESVPVLGSISVKQLWFACEYTLAKKLNEAVITDHLIEDNGHGYIGRRY